MSAQSTLEPVNAPGARVFIAVVAYWRRDLDRLVIFLDILLEV